MRRNDAGYVALNHAVGNRTGAPILVATAHRNPAVPEAYVASIAIDNTMNHEVSVFHRPKCSTCISVLLLGLPRLLSVGCRSTHR